MINRLSSRRDCLKLLAGTSAAVAMNACRPPGPSVPDPVVLYTSADAFLVQRVTAEFTRATGIGVRAVTDSEATKTAGLVQRLVTERSAPRGEVWWSSEVIGSVSLAREGLLAPSAPRSLHEEFQGSWPGGLCDARGLWWGFGQRARAVVFSTTRVKRADVPLSLDALASFAPSGVSGRVAVAQPQFGTTRTHLAWVVAAGGGPKARELLARLRGNCRLYPGNSAVVRAVAQGECDVGLTDSDDVWAGKASGWAVDASFAVGGWEYAALMIPNTAALVARATPRREARALVDFLVSAGCERLLAESESRNVPVRDGLREEIARTVPEVALPAPASNAVGGRGVDWAAVGEALDTADAMIAEVFPV